MSIKRLLTTTDAFDDMIDGATIDIWQALRPIGQDPSSFSVIEYLYQDYTYDASLFHSKDRIMQIEFSRSDFIDQGISNSNANFAKFFIKSKMYAKMARARTLSYFNKITFQS
jgi:hypothetical protein